MTEKIIMYDSSEAAKPATSIGWVNGHGLFFRDEHTARYTGCTHIKCKICGYPTTNKEYATCDKCRDTDENSIGKRLARQKDMPPEFNKLVDDEFWNLV